MNALSWPRKVLDKTWIRPKLIRQQSAVLDSGMPLLGVSTYTMKRLGLNVHGASADIRYLPIPIESNFFQPRPDKSKKKGRMGFAGRISDKRKNARLLFEAFHELRRRNVLRELHVAGHIDDYAKHLSNSIGVSDSVIFHGYLSRDELRNLYQSLEIFAITSYSEGLGIAALEAMACGVPVVSTRCGGPEDYVEDGMTGYISPDSPKEFADRVGQLLGNPKDYERISVQCRRTASERFSVDVFSDALDNAWLSVWGESYRL